MSNMNLLICVCENEPGGCMFHPRESFREYVEGEDPIKEPELPVQQEGKFFEVPVNS